MEEEQIIPMEDTTVVETVPEDAPQTSIADRAQKYQANYMHRKGIDPSTFIDMVDAEQSLTDSLNYATTANLLYGGNDVPEESFFDIADAIVADYAYQIELKDDMSEEEQVQAIESNNAMDKVKKSQEKMDDNIKALQFSSKYMPNLPQEFQEFIGEEMATDRPFTDIVKELQRHVGVKVDGYLGKDTSKALQSKVLEDKAPEIVNSNIEWIDTAKLKGYESSESDGETVPYPDGDFYSVGWGHFLTPKEKKMYEGLTTEEERVEQNKKWFIADVPEHLGRIKKRLPKFDALSTKLKNNLLFSTYRGSITGSPAAIKLINKSKYKEAAVEFLDNDEYRSAKKAGSSIAKRMEDVAEALNEE